MTDDPRDILKAAGVECPEVEAYVAQRDDAYDAEDYVRLCEFGSDAAILALARLAVKFKWQRDQTIVDWSWDVTDPGCRAGKDNTGATKLADLVARWQARDA